MKLLNIKNTIVVPMPLSVKQIVKEMYCANKTQFRDYTPKWEELTDERKDFENNKEQIFKKAKDYFGEGIDIEAEPISYIVAHNN
nr:hypothetical protein [Bacteroidota bacterium]